MFTFNDLTNISGLYKDLNTVKEALGLLRRVYDEAENGGRVSFETLKAMRKFFKYSEDVEAENRYVNGR